MASACVTKTGIDDSVGLLDRPPACPRISFTLDSGNGETETPEMETETEDLADFEFQIENPAGVLPAAADELFSGGKLVPLHPAADPTVEIRSPEVRSAAIGRSEVCAGSALSPKAPRCSSRWRELLGLKKQQQQQPKQGSKPANPNLKRFLHRPKCSTSDSFLTHPLLQDSDSESVSLSSRRSLSSSSSSGADHDELPRVSLDSDKPSQIPNQISRNPARVTASKPGSSTAAAGRGPARRRAPDPAAATRGSAIESPRMNSSGRVVFQGLERSTSSPGSFNGGPRTRHLGMERSYSTGVRIRPVINVPVSVFGLGQLFVSQKKERDGSSVRSSSSNNNNNNNSGYRCKIDR